MDSTIFSTAVLITELLVTASVLYIFYSGYKHNIFHTKLAFVTLAYEILFNINYMAHRVPAQENAAKYSTTYLIIAAFHGIFSLLMFVALIVFIIFAWRGYKKQINYFLIHKNITKVFIACWMLAIFSGIIFYVISYL